MDNDLAIGKIAFGKRPALIAVDLSNGFIDTNSPLGGASEDVLNSNRHLVNAFRSAGWPVFFTTVAYSNDYQASVFRQRLPDLNILKAGSHWVDIESSFNVSNADHLITKQWPSAFFHTDLSSRLKELKVDCLVVSGLTTSGCVRATVIDALQHNYPTVVAADACGDRNETSHRANLHDMHAKYAYVMSVDEVIKQFCRQNIKKNDYS